MAIGVIHRVHTLALHMRRRVSPRIILYSQSPLHNNRFLSKQTKILKLLFKQTESLLPDVLSTSGILVHGGDNEHSTITGDLDMAARRYAPNNERASREGRELPERRC